MNGTSQKPKYIALRGSLVAWKHLFQKIVFLISLGFCSSTVSWSQLSTAAPNQPPELTPLPHPEIAKPAMLVPSISVWIIITISFAVLALLVLLIWLLFRKKILKPPYSPPPLKYALERMSRLQAEFDKLHPSEVGHRVSSILRDYQMGRYALPAPFRTSEELYGIKSTINREEHKKRFSPLSALYDRLEFASQPATKADSLGLIEMAIQALLEEKHYQETHLPPLMPAKPLLTEPTTS